MKSGLGGFLCFIVLCITLSLGLWPFHAPRNDVTWLNDGSGLAFGKQGTVMSLGVLKVASSQERESGSIEIWVRPDRWQSSATILTLYSPEHGIQFALRQSLSDLEVSAQARTLHGQVLKSHFYADDAFGPALRKKKTVLVSVTSGQHGTSVYLNGVLTRVAPQFRVGTGAFAGRVVLGDAPKQPDSFRGEIRGLAIYDSELDSARILRHFKTWTGDGRPDISQDERNTALYLFDEHTGDVIRSHAETADCDLYVPKNYRVIDKIALEPFWNEFNFSRSYWSGNVKNIVGFIPFGFCFSAWFRIARIKRAALLTIILGAFVSLIIEVLQAFLPTRDSGTTDIITNTIGTYIGVLCCSEVYPMAAKMFPWMAGIAPPSQGD